MDDGLEDLAVKMFDERNYSMEVKGRFDGSDGWALSILEFPGCFASCERLEDARSAMRETAIAWLTTALAIGYRIPEPGCMDASVEDAKSCCLVCHGSGIMETMREGDDTPYPTECSRGCPIPREES